MSLFETLLEIKTGEKNLMIKAVYIPNVTAWWEGSYFIYYYDLLNHSFYINDLDWLWTEERVSAINIIETIASKMFLQEINAYGLIVKKILQSKKPIVIYFYNQKNTKMIILDRVNLHTVRNRKGEIVSFKNPTWGNNGSEKFKPENLK